MRKLNSTIAALLAVLAAACSNDTASSNAGVKSTKNDNPDAGSGGAPGSGGQPATSDAAPDASEWAKCTGTESTDEKFSQALQALRDVLKQAHLPGGAIAVIQDGKLSNLGVVGTKRNSVCDPITPDTLFYTGTATTPLITALATLDATEDGKLSLTAPITDYVKLAPLTDKSNGDASQITLHDLLTYSGNYSVEKSAANQASDCAPSLYDAFATAKNPILKAKPGTMPDEMFMNFEMAGLALENVDKVPYPEAVAKRVLTPLSMGGSFDPATIAASDHVVGHLGGTFESQVDNGQRCPNHDPSAGYWGSIRDAAKLAEYLMGGAGGILDQATLDTVLSNQGPSFWTINYQFLGGWGLANSSEDSVASNCLGWGFNTEFRIYKKHRLAVIAYLNGEPASDYAYGSVWPATIVLNRVSEIYEPALKEFNTVGSDPNYKPDPASLPSLVGTYRDDIGFKGIRPRTLAVSLDPSDSGKLTGTLTAPDGTSDTVRIDGAWSADNFRFTVGPNEYEARFWRDTAGEGSAVQLFADSGPPFIRVP